MDNITNNDTEESKLEQKLSDKFFSELDICDSLFNNKSEIESNEQNGKISGVAKCSFYGNESKVKPINKDILDENKALKKNTVKNVSFLKEFNFLSKTDDSIEAKPETKNTAERSLLHNGDTDDSDDEDNRNPFERKYNEFGKFVKSRLKEEEQTQTDRQFHPTSTWKTKTAGPNSGKLLTQDSFQSILGISLINPLVTPSFLRDKMSGRSLISFTRLKSHSESIMRKDKSLQVDDWIVACVVVGKSAPKQSQKGSKYSIWKISDLKLGLKTASLFLFGGAQSQLWKRPVGTVVGVLNPNIMESSRKECSDEACLSVFNADQVLICGQSKDLGFCRARKKNGENCTMFVNKNSCEFCVYHVQKEYKKFSNRSELQSPIANGLQNLRNKVLGKNEVFYGGQSFTAVKGKQSNKSVEKDKNRLKKLFNTSEEFQQSFKSIQNSEAPKAPNIDFTRFKRIQDAERLSMLSKSNNTECEPSSTATSAEGMNKLEKLSKFKSNIPIQPSNSKTDHSKIRINKPVKLTSGKYKDENIAFISEKDFSDKSFAKSSCSINDDKSKNIPESQQSIGPNEFSREALSNFFEKSKPSLNSLSNAKKYKNSSVVTSPSTSTLPIIVDVSRPVTSRDKERAKKIALKYVRNRGGIKKVDPNQVKNKTEYGKKRPRPKSEYTEDVKKNENLLPDRFVELMNKTSKHLDLIEDADEKAFNQYFDKMNKKEEMEEKMLTTFKLACKAVKCINCRYTWFSASELCKAEKHIIKVVDATKRFFSCNSCGSRTISLEIIPLITCRNCGSSSWKRAPMMSEKKQYANLNQLSIRGGEQIFVNSQMTNGSLNLLVPDT